MHSISLESNPPNSRILLWKPTYSKSGKFDPDPTRVFRG